MNIDYPDKSSKIYHQFLDMTNQKVNDAMAWLGAKGIEYVWNYWIDNHLYRLYIPDKDVLLDFECYPVCNDNYNYIRINYDADIIKVLEKLFPETILKTNDLNVWKLNQKVINKFLKDNDVSPVYDKNVLRLGWVKDGIIYQGMVLQEDKIIRKVTKQNCNVELGIYMLLRYFNEVYGINHIKIPETLDNSYANMLYQILGLPYVKSIKRKVWWSPDKVVWRTSDKNSYIPFYLCESVEYIYS